MAWGGANPSYLDRLVKLQKKCIRNVSGAKYRDHTEPIFYKLKRLKFEDLYFYHAATFMHNYHFHHLPESFLNFFPICPAANILTTRQNNYQIKRARTKMLGNLPTVKLPLIWNSLNNALKVIQRRATFNAEVKKYLLEKYNAII